MARQDNIQIDLQLFADLRSKMPPEADRFAVPRGFTIGNVLEKLEISPERAKLIFVNGIKQALDYILKDGDRVGIFPPIGGG